MARLRILHIANSLGAGGAERFVADLAQAQLAAGDRPNIVTLSDAADLGDSSGLDAARRRELETAGIDVHCLGHRARQWVLPAAQALRRVVEKLKPDVIHSHLLTGLVLLRVGGIGGPVVATHHNTPLPAPGWLFRLIARRADAYAAIATDALPQLAQVYRGPVELIPNGIFLDPAVTPEERADGPLQIISLGSLKQAKNYPRLVDIAAALRDRGIAARFRIAGEGPERQAIEQRIAERGVQDSVELLGVRSDAGALLRASDLYLLTSDWEGMPIALLEALQAGLPVIAADVGGCREIIGQDGGCGFLVRPDDRATYCDRIAGLAEDTDRRRAMAAVARARAGEFSIAKCQAAYRALYERVLR